MSQTTPDGRTPETPPRAPVSSWVGSLVGIFTVVGVLAALAVAMRTNAMGDHPDAWLGVALLAIVVLLSLVGIAASEVLKKVEDR